MNIDIVNSRLQFDALEENWTAVYRQDPSASVFMSWRWLKQLYDRRAEPVCILAARSDAADQDYVAFLPLRPRLFIDRDRHRFVMSYALAGNDWADQTGLLCAPDIENTAIEALSEALAQMHWRSLSFTNMWMTESRYTALTTQFSQLDYSISARFPTDNDGETRLDVAPVIALPGKYESYLDSLRPNTRQRLRRFARSLEKSDDLQIQFSTAATREQDLTSFVQFWRDRWLDSKGSRAEMLAQKYRTILEQGLEDGNLVLLTLYQSGRPIAMNACYLDDIRKSVSFFVAARDLQFDVLPSGLLLHSRMIEWAIANHYRRYHLLRGNEPYKYSLGGIDQPVRSIKVRRSNAVEMTRFLPAECRCEALQQLHEKQERLGERQTHRLYSQLLESWPGDRQTLTHYKNWLNRMGDHEHASGIEDTLRAAESDLTHSGPCDSALQLNTLVSMRPNQQNNGSSASNDLETGVLRTKSN